MTHECAEADGRTQSKPPYGRLVYLLPDDRDVSAGYEFQFSSILQVLRQGWLTILLITFGCGAVGAAYAFVTPAWYRADVKLMPVERQPMQGVLSQLSQWSGLAGAVGVDLGRANQSGEALETLRSRAFTMQFIKENNLLTTLFADKWDAEAGSWKGNESEWPDERDAIKYLERNVRTIEQDRKSGVVTLAVEWKDPVIAARWANVMAARINVQMRERAMTDAESNIEYLRQTLEATPLLAMQESLGRVLELEMQKYLFARGNPEFAFRVIDPALVPRERTRPNRVLVIAGAALLGVLLSASIVLIRGLRRSEEAK
jgi:uncharacterized protein involved in exopolysaccharide biosynthesis